MPREKFKNIRKGGTFFVRLDNKANADTPGNPRSGLVVEFDQEKREWYRAWAGDKQATINRIINIIENYSERGFTLTVRQLYYQLVGRDWIPNHIKAYKKVIGLLKDCRLGGMVDWWDIEDRGRVPHLLWSAKDVPDGIRKMLGFYRLNRQKGQDVHIEVWTEKDAISGMIKQFVDPYHLRICVNKGFTSLSAIYNAYKRMRMIIADRKKVKILYLGDHDPSGLDMIRDIRDRLTTMFLQGDWAHRFWEMGYYWTNEKGEYLADIYPESEWYGDMYIYEQDDYYIDCAKAYIHMMFEVIPIGLTMAQIAEYDLPPNPAKLTDSRSAAYIEEHGPMSWEVDALTPEQLQEILTHHMEKHIDMEKYQIEMAKEMDDRQQLTNLKGIWNAIANDLEASTKMVGLLPGIAHLLTDTYFLDQMGSWICPVCGEEEKDPNRIGKTVCKNDHPVVLTNFALSPGDERNAVNHNTD